MFNKPNNKPPSFKWHHRLKTLITLRWKHGIPRLVIHEKYEKTVKWLLRALAFIGIVTSILYFPAWYLSLLSAIVLLAIEQFLERAIFLYTIFYFLPFPEFKWDVGEEIVSMGFAFPESKNEAQLNLVGPVFKSESYAREFFEYISKWNYGNQEDKYNNICLSLVKVDDGYFTFIYPNLERPSIKETFSNIEESKKLEKYGKEPQKFVVQNIFCKHFVYGTNSLFERFEKEQASGNPYWLQSFIESSDGSTSILFSVKPILKYHIKIKHRNELEQREFEHEHFKYVIDVKSKMK